MINVLGLYASCKNHSRTTANSGGRAWAGAVETMQLAVSKIKRQAWKPRWSSDQAVRLAAEQPIRSFRMDERMIALPPVQVSVSISLACKHLAEDEIREGRHIGVGSWTQRVVVILASHQA